MTEVQVVVALIGGGLILSAVGFVGYVCSRGRAVRLEDEHIRRLLSDTDHMVP